MTVDPIVGRQGGDTINVEDISNAIKKPGNFGSSYLPMDSSATPVNNTLEHGSSTYSWAKGWYYKIFGRDGVSVGHTSNPSELIDMRGSNANQKALFKFNGSNQTVIRNTTGFNLQDNSGNSVLTHDSSAGTLSFGLPIQGRVIASGMFFPRSTNKYYQSIGQNSLNHEVFSNYLYNITCWLRSSTINYADYEFIFGSYTVSTRDKYKAFLTTGQNYSFGGYQIPSLLANGNDEQTYTSTTSFRMRVSDPSNCWPYDQVAMYILVVETF